MSSFEERAEQLQARAGEFLPAWRPDRDGPNPLVGIVTGFSETETHYGVQKIMHVRDNAGKEWAIYLSRKALSQAVERDNPQPGQMAYLKYLGMKLSSSTGREYHAYEVIIESASDAAFQPEPDPAPADDSIPF